MNNDRIYEQLELIAGRIPTTYFMAVVTLDGLAIAQWLPHPIIEDDAPGEEEFLVPAMSAAMLSLGERVSRGLGAGIYKLAIISGSGGTVFEIGLGDELVLIFGLREFRTVDTVLVVLQQWWDELLQLLNVPASKL